MEKKKYNNKKKFYNKKRNNKTNNKNNNTQPNTNQLKPSEKIFNDWLQLIEKQIVERKKYYNIFGSEKSGQIRKQKNTYEGVVTKLINFEKKIPKHLKDRFNQLKKIYNNDTTYSTLNNITDEVFEPGKNEEEIFSPHLKQSQIEHNYIQDSEESAGTIEDYNAYKGN